MPLENDLVVAAYKGDVANVERLLRSNVSVNCRAEYDDKPQKIFSLGHPYIDRIKALYPRPVEEDKEAWKHHCSRLENLRTFSPLAAAIYGKQYTMVERLLNLYGADINATFVMHCYCERYHWNDSIGDLTVLTLAIIVGDEKILSLILKHLQVKKLLEEFLNKNIRLLDWKELILEISPIETVLLLGARSILSLLDDYLLEAKIGLDQIISAARLPEATQITCAIAYLRTRIKNKDKTAVVKEIIESHVLVDSVMANRLAVFNFFIEYLSDDELKTVMSRDFLEDGNPMLCEAVFTQNTRVVKLWLAANADPNDQSGKDKNSALHFALMKEQQNLDLVKPLLDAGANPNLKNDQGNTALHLALLRPSCDFAITEQLIRHGADITLTNNDRKTPLNLCQPFLVAEIKRLILQMENEQDEDEDEDMKSAVEEPMLAAQPVNDQKEFQEQLVYQWELVDQQPTVQVVGAKNPKPVASTNTGCCLPWFNRKKQADYQPLQEVNDLVLRRTVPSANNAANRQDLNLS